MGTLWSAVCPAADKEKQINEDLTYQTYLSEEQSVDGKILTILVNGNNSEIDPDDNLNALSELWKKHGHRIMGKDVIQIDYVGTQSHEDMIKRTLNAAEDKLKVENSDGTPKYKKIQLCGISLGGNIVTHAADRLADNHSDKKIIVSTSSSPKSGANLAWHLYRSLWSSEYKNNMMTQALNPVTSKILAILATILSPIIVPIVALINPLPHIPDLSTKNIKTLSIQRKNDNVVPLGAQIEFSGNKSSNNVCCKESGSHNDRLGTKAQTSLNDQYGSLFPAQQNSGNLENAHSATEQTTLVSPFEPLPSTNQPNRIESNHNSSNERSHSIEESHSRSNRQSSNNSQNNPEHSNQRAEPSKSFQPIFDKAPTEGSNKRLTL